METTIKIGDLSSKTQSCFYKIKGFLNKYCSVSQMPKSCTLNFYSNGSDKIYCTLKYVDDISEGVSYKFEYYLIDLTAQELYKLSMAEHREQLEKVKTNKIEIIWQP